MLHFLKDKTEERNETIMINFSRAFFVGLIIFEALNVLKIVQFNTQFTWLGLLITSLFTLTLLETIAYKYKKIKGHHLHWSIWLIATVALWLDAAGDFFHLYAKIEWWDRVVHYGVSAILAFTLFAIINAFWIDKFQYSLLFKTGKLKLALFLAASSSISLGAIYEIEEYVEDLLFHTNRLGPGTDTANDLSMNVLGVLTTVSIISIYFIYTKKRKIID